MTAREISSGDLFFAWSLGTYVTDSRFMRRDWLATELAQHLEEPACRFVLLRAEPGAGKSTFAAQLAADHPDWLCYFIRRDQRSTLSGVGARSFLLRIGYQFAAHH